MPHTPLQCSHYGRCGGCQAQDISYEKQLNRKAEMLRELFAPFWTADIEVTPSPVVWQYRNKIDPAFAPKRYDEPPPPGFIRETVLGFKEKGRWFHPIDLQECLIGPAGTDVLLRDVNAWLRTSGLRGFDNRSGEGFLRALLVRDAKRTGQRMVVLITRPGEFDPTSFIEAVQETFRPNTICRGIYSGTADLAFAEELEPLYGDPFIQENLFITENVGREIWPTPDKAIAAGQRSGRDAVALKLPFRISPMSFFQTNPLAAERLYGHIRHWVRQVAPDYLHDLYGGMGGIAFTCADLVRHIWSVEEVSAASEDGRHIAGMLGIDNVTFITDRVRNYLMGLLADKGLPPRSAVIADPPRSGMNPKAVRRLLEARPSRILYVSCNPKILAGELPAFLEFYELTGLKAVDMFPHTRHVEVLADLSLRREV